MQLTNATVLQLGWAISQISEQNKDTGFPLYDMGWKANYAMGVTLRKCKELMVAIEKERNRIAEAKLKLSGEKRDLLKVPPSEVAEASKANKLIAARMADLDQEWEEYTKKTVEAPVHTVALADVKCAGVTPSPAMLDALGPIFTE